MRFFAHKIAASTLRVFCALLSLSLVLALSRLMPWLVDPNVTARVVVPFARALLTGALEVSVSVALPLGFALAATALVDSGEAQVAQLSGRSPLEVACAGWPVIVAFGALSIATSLAWGVRPHDGAALLELVAEARRGCAGRALSEVPGMGVAWSCRPTPRLLGVFSDALAVDVGGLSLSRAGDVELVNLRASLRGPPALTLTVAQATVRGLSPREPPSGAVGGKKAVAEVAVAGLGAIGAFTLIVRRAWGHRAIGLLLGAIVAAVSLATGALFRF